MSGNRNLEVEPLTFIEAVARFKVEWYRAVASVAKSWRLSPKHWERRAEEAEHRRWTYRYDVTGEYGPLADRNSDTK